MVHTLTLIGCTILAVLALFQLSLAFGAPLGKFAWGGTATVLPKKLRISSLVAILLYGIFAMALMDKAGLADPIRPDLLTTAMMWIVTVYLFLGTLMNAASKSKHERAVMTPVSLALALIFLSITLH